jgi:dTDP-4-amino-4,6-dideoxygalactose transaminase
VSYRIYLSPPDVGHLEEEFVLDALRSGWVAPLGPHVDAFEQEVADYVGVEHAVALSSGTAALHLGLLALGVAAGDEVVVPTMTFAATAFAVRYVGATPVFVDSEPQSFNMDPDLLSSLLADRAAAGRPPAAVILVDIYGQTADYARLLSICLDYGVPVLEDAAEALGATHGERMAGSFGRLAVFSFNGNKIMTSSGGGMLVSDDATIVDRVRHLATQARNPVPWYEHEDIGFNYRLSNVLAAVGRAQLRRLPGFIDRRSVVHRSYTRLLGGTGVTVLTDAPWGRSNHWLTVVRLRIEQVDRVSDGMRVAGIETRRAWKPMHLQPVFRDCEFRGSNVAAGLFDTGLCLPSGSALDETDVSDICRTLTALLEVSPPSTAPLSSDVMS